MQCFRLGLRVLRRRVSCRAAQDAYSQIISSLTRKPIYLQHGGHLYGCLQNYLGIPFPTHCCLLGAGLRLLSLHKHHFNITWVDSRYDT